MATGALKLGNPKAESPPVTREQVQVAGDLIRERIALNVFFNRRILDEPIWLGERREQANRFATVPAAKAPDEDKERPEAQPTQIPGVVTQ